MVLVFDEGTHCVFCFDASNNSRNNSRNNLHLADEEFLVAAVYKQQCSSQSPRSPREGLIDEEVMQDVASVEETSGVPEEREEDEVVEETGEEIVEESVKMTPTIEELEDDPLGGFLNAEEGSECFEVETLYSSPPGWACLETSGIQDGARLETSGIQDEVEMLSTSQVFSRSLISQYRSISLKTK